MIYGTFLLASSSYILLDTFVIPKGQVVVAQTNTATTITSSTSVSGTSATATATSTSTGTSTTSTSSSSTPVITDSSYQDENISITITSTRQYDTNIYIADIQVSSAEYLKTAFANATYGRNVKATTSQTASDVGAILAINGDYYGFRDDGAVVRNGVLYRSTVREGDITEALVVGTDGSFDIIDETQVDVATMDLTNVAQILSFGPALIDDGQIVVDASDEVNTKSNSLSNPRTAIGMISPLHYVMVVTDGRSSDSTGLTLEQLATVLQDLGVTVGYNLDGGGSSTMVFNGVVVNQPSSNGGSGNEREVSDIVYIGY